MALGVIHQVVGRERGRRAVVPIHVAARQSAAERCNKQRWQSRDPSRHRRGPASALSIKSKAGLLDYLRTPDGLGSVHWRRSDGGAARAIVCRLHEHGGTTWHTYAGSTTLASPSPA